MASSSASISNNWAPRDSPAASRAEASCPLDLAWPTALALALRSARNRSASICTTLRRSSKTAKLSTSSTKPRGASAAATPVKSLRSSFGSSTVCSLVRVLIYSNSNSRAAGAACPAVALAARVQRLADLDLQSARHRHIVVPVRHLVGKVSLAGRVAARFIMRIAITLAIADFLHQAGRRVAQMQRHFERTQAGGIGRRRIVGRVHRIAFGRARHEHDGLRNGEFAFGGAQ